MIYRAAGDSGVVSEIGTSCWRTGRCEFGSPARGATTGRVRWIPAPFLGAGPVPGRRPGSLAPARFLGAGPVPGRRPGSLATFPSTVKQPLLALRLPVDTRAGTPFCMRSSDLRPADVCERATNGDHEARGPGVARMVASDGPRDEFDARS